MADSLRLATLADGSELARLRWDFSPEEAAGSSQSFEEFRGEFERFLEPALASGNWAVWVAEQEGRLVSQIWVQVIHKAPRPGRFGGHNRYGYMTNVFTVPERRGQGIGGQLLERVIQWAREQELQFLVVWPSEESVRFYERGGFRATSEALELRLDE